MQLTLEQIRAIAQGALSVVQNAQGQFEFRRFTAYQQSCYDAVEAAFAEPAHATSGVRLAFMTDSAEFSFDYRVKSVTGRRFYYFDVFVDGVMVEHFGHEGLCEATSAANIKLPEGTHRVEVYFPCLFDTLVCNVTLDDGAMLAPVKKPRRMLCYGDSITQGYDAVYPSQTYANLIADKLGCEMINQGVGGEIFRPELIDPDMGFDPDIITVAYGTEDWSGLSRDAMVENANGFFAKLRATYPAARIFAITPIWRADDARVTAVGSFAEGAEIVRNAAAAQQGVIIVDGARMIPHMPEVLADGKMNPSDFGFKFYANALHKAMRPYFE